MWNLVSQTWNKAKQGWNRGGNEYTVLFNTFADFNDNRDKKSYATQDRSHGMISGCDTVVLGHLQVYPQGNNYY